MNKIKLLFAYKDCADLADKLPAEMSDVEKRLFIEMFLNNAYLIYLNLWSLNADLRNLIFSFIDEPFLESYQKAQIKVEIALSKFNDIDLNKAIELYDANDEDFNHFIERNSLLMEMDVITDFRENHILFGETLSELFKNDLLSFIESNELMNVFHDYENGTKSLSDLIVWCENRFDYCHGVFVYDDLMWDRQRLLDLFLELLSYLSGSLPVSLNTIYDNDVKKMLRCTIYHKKDDRIVGKHKPFFANYEDFLKAIEDKKLELNLSELDSKKMFVFKGLKSQILSEKLANS